MLSRGSYQVLTLLLQGTFGWALRSDHTCKVARKVVLSSGTMSSYAVMNENWMILSWVTLQSECDRALYPMYEGLAQRYTLAGQEKAKLPVGGQVPQPRELLQRVEDVLHHFHFAKDANDVLLFKPSMLKVWRIQRIHILRGCLSDPEVEDGILYRYGGNLQLNYTKGEGAAVPVWIPVRGTSQQEGFHFHQAQWVTGNRVSSELFQAQAMTGVVHWNFQRLVDLTQPDVDLPAVFDPLLITQLNTSSLRVTGKAKYPVLQVANRDTGERFGLEYVEPGCCPVVLNWDKDKTQPSSSAVEAMELQQHPAQDQAHPCPAAVVGTDPQETRGTVQDDLVVAAPILASQQCAEAVSPFQLPLIPASATAKAVDADLTEAAALPLSSSPRATCTGPIRTGGLIQVLDHSRWTPPMKASIYGLLIQHHGTKDLLWMQTMLTWYIEPALIPTASFILQHANVSLDM